MSDWHLVNKDGQTYYWNTITNETSWENPEEPVEDYHEDYQDGDEFELNEDDIDVDDSVSVRV